MVTESIQRSKRDSDTGGVSLRRANELPAEQAVELEVLLTKLARRMFVLVPDHPTTKLSVVQLRICSVLLQHPHTVTELARELSASLSNTSQLVERLVRQGLVERYETRDGRRRRLLRLSPGGLHVMESRKEYRTERAMAALAALEPAVRVQMLHALQQLIEAATAASPLRVVPASAPEWVTRVMREAEMPAGRSTEDVFNSIYN